jgi:hypothetical protein
MRLVLDIIDCEFYFGLLIDGILRWECDTSQEQWVSCSLEQYMQTTWIQ